MGEQRFADVRARSQGIRENAVWIRTVAARGRRAGARGPAQTSLYRVKSVRPPCARTAPVRKRVLCAREGQGAIGDFTKGKASGSDILNDDVLRLHIVIQAGTAV